MTFESLNALIKLESFQDRFANLPPSYTVVYILRSVTRNFCPSLTYVIERAMKSTGLGANFLF